MLVETGILGGDEGVYQIGRQLVVVDPHAVLLAVVTPQRFAIGGEKLRSVFILRILQFL